MMSPQDQRRIGDRPGGWGYVVSIIIAALGHAVFFFVVLVILPGLMSKAAPPPAYTVKIVDSIPAGDLGTHLPRLSQDRKHNPPPATPEVKAQPTPPPIPPEPDDDAIALNTIHSSPTPTPKPTPRPKPTPAPTIAPQPTATPRPKKHPRVAAPTPTATPTPGHSRRHQKPTPVPEVVAKAEATPSVKERLDKVRAQLLHEHEKDVREAEKENPAQSISGGGPVAADTETAGKGYGVGPGSGSAGIEQDPGFLLYTQEVQRKIKGVWSFPGSDPNLKATVTLGINPDGSLSSLQLTDSSRDPAFDDSVMRAIRRAAPFPPPPEKYRSLFAAGLPANFKSADLNAGKGG